MDQLKKEYDLCKDRNATDKFEDIWQDKNTLIEF